VAFGELNERSRDIMSLKIGNVPPKGSVRIAIEFMQTLEVSLNTFWRLNVQSHVWPRYINDGLKSMGQNHVNFKWGFKIELRTAHKCIHFRSTSHKLV
jgi:hypothetical protein